MKHCSQSCRFRLITCLIAVYAVRGHSAQLVDDRAITVHSAREVTEKREELIRYLWGKEGFPKKRLPDGVQTNVASPVKQLGHLARVDEFHDELLY